MRLVRKKVFIRHDGKLLYPLLNYLESCPVGLPQASSTSAATPAAKKSDFFRQVEEVKTPKSDINALILDYLTMSGYPNAAARFSAEANLQPQQNTPSISARQEIQLAILRGDISTAIATLNDLDPEILDTNAELHFALLRLELIELIRRCKASPSGDIEPALNFATHYLGPRAPTNPQFLQDLEETMTLLVFPDDPVHPHLAALLKPELRRGVATTVNKAILQRQMDRQSAAISSLVHTRAWAEETLRKDNKRELPARMELGLLDDEMSDSASRALNGHEDSMVVP